jgi:hypothetical protein
MNNWKKLSLVCLLTVLPLSCQAEPFAKIFHYAARHKELILADAVIIAAWSADAASTVNDTHNCPNCVETNPFLGAHPSAHAVWLSAMGFSATQTAVNHLIWHYAPASVYRHMIWAQGVMLGSTEANNVYGNVQAAQSSSRANHPLLRGSIVPLANRAAVHDSKW